MRLVTSSDHGSRQLVLVTGQSQNSGRSACIHRMLILVQYETLRETVGGWARLVLKYN